ncbi:MAG: SWIM zinc finger family protein [Ferruginibacter sp.]
MNLSEDQILALAPDEASKKAGRDLSGITKWVSKGINEQALWGECQGSGSKPYQTQVDLRSLSFKCSCPSRKFPCKHGLGLLFLHEKHPGLFTDREEPAWVAEWMKKKQEREEKKVEKTEQPVDEAAQLKRRQAREKSVDNGIAELLRWTKDIIRNCIITIPEKGENFLPQWPKE